MSARQWKQFAAKVRPGRTDLLRSLPNFPDSILVAGCQRSGGTMLANAITQHVDIASFGWSKDAELDAARLLSGESVSEFKVVQNKRYCFQTTYLNEQAPEYLEHVDGMHLIWLIRNPHSVVYSMVHNWKKFALNEVFLACGTHLLDDKNANRLQTFGVWSIPPVYRAAYAYLGKLEQAKMLSEKLPSRRMAICEYEEIVTRKPEMLQKLFEFCDLAVGDNKIGSEISVRSLKKAAGLSLKSRAIVDDLCITAYEDFCKNYLTLSTD